MRSFPFVRPAARRVLTGLLAWLALQAAPAGAQGTSLSLGDAMQRAALRAVANRTARADRDAASAQRVAAWRSVLPTVRAEAGFARTTDPVGAFGTSLRQRRITVADFDPSQLNHPDAISNYSAAVVVEQPLLMLDGWMAARAAGKGAESEAHRSEWTAVQTNAEVVDAFYGAVLAAEHATTVAAAARAAQAHARQAELLLEAGLVTRSDVLLASVRAGELDAARLDAVRDSILAGRQLAVLLGEPGDVALATPTTFPTDSVAERLATEVLGLTPRTRADIAWASAGTSAAELDVARARAAFVPRLVSFARADVNSAVRPGAGSSNWTVGVMASWTPFSGASELGERRAAEARRAGARAQLEGAMARTRVDLERTELSLQSSLARLSVARVTMAQATEAHRIVTRKYEGGLATVVELLDAAAVETQARTTLSKCRHALLVAIADRLRATGHDPATMAQALDPTALSRP